jgi:hypothetical protein
MIFDTCDICGREMRPQTGPHSIAALIEIADRWELLLLAPKPAGIFTTVLT